MTIANPWAVAFAQLTTPTAPASQVERFNPRPAGVVRRGSPTHILYEFMAEAPERWFTEMEIRRFTGLSHSAASYAILFLSRRGFVDTTTDPRNGRYQRYRIRHGVEAVISETPYQTASLPRPVASTGGVVGDVNRDVQTREEGRTCSDCDHLAAAGRCIRSGASGVEWPEQRTLRRCAAFQPKFEASDQRSGLQLWPELKEEASA